MKLIYGESGEEVRVGDVVVLRGNEGMVKVLSFSKPHKPSSSGKVYVHFIDDGIEKEVYVGVIGAVWIEREDQRELTVTEKITNALPEGAELIGFSGSKVICHLPKNKCTPFVGWTIEYGFSGVCWGHYFSDRKSALKWLQEEIKKQVKEAK